MKSKILVASVFAATSLLDVPSASARCRSSSANFFPDQNDSVTFYVVGDGRCGHNFSSGSNGVLSSLSVVRQPANGKLMRMGQFGFAYLAKKGFKGTDAYIMKLCATNMGRSGCSTLTYRVTVE